MNHTLSNTVFSHDAPGAIASFHEGPKNVATWLAAHVIPFYLFSFLTWQIMHCFPHTGRHGEWVHHASSALCSFKWKWPLAEFSVMRLGRHLSFILQKEKREWTFESLMNLLGHVSFLALLKSWDILWWSATEMFTQMCMKVLQPPGVSLYIFRL